MAKQFYMTHSTTIPGQNGSDNERVLHIPQSSKIGASSSDVLVSYPEHLLQRCS